MVTLISAERGPFAHLGITPVEFSLMFLVNRMIFKSINVYWWLVTATYSVYEGFFAKFFWKVEGICAHACWVTNCWVRIFPHRSSTPLYMHMCSRGVQLRPAWVILIECSTIRARAANNIVSLLLGCGS